MTKQLALIIAVLSMGACSSGSNPTAPNPPIEIPLVDSLQTRSVAPNEDVTIPYGLYGMMKVQVHYDIAEATRKGNPVLRVYSCVSNSEDTVILSGCSAGDATGYLGSVTNSPTIVIDNSLKNIPTTTKFIINVLVDGDLVKSGTSGVGFELPLSRSDGKILSKEVVPHRWTFSN